MNSAVREKAHDRPAPHAASDPAGSRRRAAGHPEFNRWLYGLVLPGAVFLWSLFILAGGRFRIPLRIRWREFVDMTGPEAYAVGFLLLLTAVLVHRVRFWYELYESPPLYWKRQDQLLLLLCLIPLGYLLWRLISLIVFGR